MSQEAVTTFWKTDKVLQRTWWHGIVLEQEMFQELCKMSQSTQWHAGSDKVP